MDFVWELTLGVSHLSSLRSIKIVSVLYYNRRNFQIQSIENIYELSLAYKLSQT